MRATMSSWRITQRPVLLGTVAAIIATMCYGSSQFLARKLVTGQAPPLVVATFSLLAGMLILASVSHRGLVRDRRAPKRAFLLIALAGFSASRRAATRRALR